jgi:hypothetical protein
VGIDDIRLVGIVLKPVCRGGNVLILFLTPTSVPVPDLVIEMKPDIFFEIDVMLIPGRPSEDASLDDVVRRERCPKARDAPTLKLPTPSPTLKPRPIPLP